MGLDITGYSEVELLQADTEEIGCIWEWRDHFEEEYPDSGPTTMLYMNRSFPEQSGDLVDGVYTYYNTDDAYLRVGYSFWSNIRNLLAKACGYKKANIIDIALTAPEILDDDNHWWRMRVESHPYQQSAFNKDGSNRLHYLLNFSDCEGVIDNEHCKIIYEDLLWLKGKDKENPCIDESLSVVFNKLLELFSFVANNNGVVKFH